MARTQSHGAISKNKTSRHTSHAKLKTLILSQTVRNKKTTNHGTNHPDPLTTNLLFPLHPIPSKPKMVRKSIHQTQETNLDNDDLEGHILIHETYATLEQQVPKPSRNTHGRNTYTFLISTHEPICIIMNILFLQTLYNQLSLIVFLFQTHP